jgi:hypothetical protein
LNFTKRDSEKDLKSCGLSSAEFHTKCGEGLKGSISLASSRNSVKASDVLLSVVLSLALLKTFAAPEESTILLVRGVTGDRPRGYPEPRHLLSSFCKGPEETLVINPLN